MHLTKVTGITLQPRDYVAGNSLCGPNSKMTAVMRLMGTGAAIWITCKLHGLELLYLCGSPYTLKKRPEHTVICHQMNFSRLGPKTKLEEIILLEPIATAENELRR